MGILKGVIKKAKNSLEEIGSHLAPSPSKWVQVDKEGIPTGNLTWRGRGVFGVAIAAGSANQAFNQYTQDRLGSNMGVVTATPDYSDYTKRGSTDLSAGADGSLVFALDRNKNGGYL